MLPKMKTSVIDPDFMAILAPKSREVTEFV